MVITHENPSPGDPIDHHLEWDMLKPGPVFVTQRNETITRSRECSDPVRAWVSEAEGCDWSVMSQLPSDWLGLIWANPGDCDLYPGPVKVWTRRRLYSFIGLLSLKTVIETGESARSSEQWYPVVFPRTQANCLSFPSSVKNQIQTHYQYRISPLFRAHLEILSATAFDPIGSPAGRWTLNSVPF